MKKLFTALVLCWIGITMVQAQVFVRGGVGVGFGVSQDAFGVPMLERDSSNLAIRQNTIFGTFGGGGRFAVAGGYWFTPSFGVELDFQYFQGFKQLYGGSKSPTGNSYRRQGYTYQMRATPSLVVQAPEGKFRPFARFGVVLPLWGRFLMEEDWDYGAPRGTRSKQTDIYGKFSVGFESSAGVLFAVNERLGVYLQATYTGLRIRAERAEVTKDEETASDGTYKDNLEDADAIFTQIEFQDVMTAESNTNALITSFIDDIPDDIVIQLNNNLDIDRPLNLPTQSINTNALFFTLGVQYTFGKE